MERLDVDVDLRVKDLRNAFSDEKLLMTELAYGSLRC
jgi:hypothetical protein